MDFFERQEKAHRNTKLLVVYFVAGVAALVLAVYLAVAAVFMAGDAHYRAGHYNYHYGVQLEAYHRTLWNPHLFLGVAIGTLAVIAIGSIFKTVELSRGGSAVPDMMGARLVNTGTTDLDERK